MPYKTQIHVAKRPARNRSIQGELVNIDSRDIPAIVRKEITSYVARISKAWRGITPANIWTENSRAIMDQFGGNTPDAGDLQIAGEWWMYCWRTVKTP